MIVTQSNSKNMLSLRKHSSVRI